ncbi:lipopolysaccharide biosynthesis protein [Microbacterium sp. BG28]|uniref:lipopolysaccharide biosynthesis protein n=1 Tax=Microbacterium sp. BG28 TaxID=3097356 RepID=UPI002A5B0A24|nr:lipopolysaccharide biosynthesis protein [Microbacterium sp. BG28]MDY0830151.1 lipopolysaccharide biosynthesis protein [Microbacterium sp. BG28]
MLQAIVDGRPEGMSDDGLRRRATRSIGWVVAERWGARFLSLGVLAILTRLLDPSQFGIVSLATSVLAISQVFVDSGFGRTLIQRKELGEKDASTAFWTSLIFSLVLATALVLTAPLIAGWFGEPALAPVLQVLSIALPLAALSQIPAALLERNLDFKPLSIRQLIGSLAGAIVSIPVALLGGGIWALVLQTLVTSATAVVALWASTSWRPKFEFSFAALRSMWSTGVAILGIDLMDAVQANIDKIVIGAFFSSTELGYYFLAQRVGTILIELVTSVMARVSLATFSRVQDDKVRLDRIFRQMTFAAAAVSVFVFGLVAALAPQIITGIFGSQWTPSVPIVWILAGGWALGAIMYFDRNVLLATGNARAALSLALVQNVVGTALVFAFVPWGVMGVAFSRLARFIVWPLRLWVLRALTRVDVWKYLLQLIRCIAAMLPVLGGIIALQYTAWASHGHLWLFALPCALVATVAYGGLLWLLAGEENRSLLRRVTGDVLARLRRR